MRLGEVVRFELRHQLRQPATWLFLALLLGLTVLLAGSTDLAMGSQLNAPVKVATLALAIGFLGTLVTSALFVEAAHRDVRSGMEPLFHTAPLRKAEYLGGRFLGVLLVNALLLLAVPAGLLLSTQLPGVTPDMLGPLRPGTYAFPYLVFLLPNLLVNAAVMFGVTVLSRRSLPGYLGALALAGVYMATLNLTVGVDGAHPGAFADPTGGVALTGATNGWTRAEQNTRLIELTGTLLWNRVLWMALAAGMLAFTYRRFRPGYTKPSSGRRATERESGPATTQVASARGGALIIPAAPRSFGIATRARQTLAFARIAARQIALGREFLIVAAGLFGFTLFMGMESRGDPMFGTPVWPLTGGIAMKLAGQLVGILMAVLTILFAGELVWRERDARAHELGDTQPLPDWVPLLGNFLAISVVLVLLQGVLLLSGIVLQALQGYYAFELAVYVRILFGLKLMDYLLFAVLALLVHVLVNNKYLGHLVAMLLFLAIMQAWRFGIEHNLLVYGSDPGWLYSDMSGFGPFVGPFVWFKLYWAAWAFLLGLIAFLFWVRGTERGLRVRVRLARQRFTPRTGVVTGGGLLLVLATGGFVFYNTNVVNEYRPAREWDAVKAEYERRYKRFESSAQPWLTGITLHVELHPDRRALDVRGTYWLVNRTSEPIDSVQLSTFRYPELRLNRVRFDRPSTPVVEDTLHGFRMYALERPLPPGDSLQMGFTLALQLRGFGNDGLGTVNTSLVGNGTYLQMMRVLPHIGYQRDLLEISDATTRREHGLGPRSFFRSLDDPEAIRVPRGSPTADWIDFEATVGTARDQIAVLPGTLQRTWVDGGRRYFHYRSDAPIMNSIHLFSARYAVREARWKDVEIRVLHHPGHASNLDRMVRAIQASLGYYSDQFGPYPHRQFSLMEIPGHHGNFGRAFPRGMMYTESNPIARARFDGAERDGMDAPLLFIAHEIAHQWWGHRVMAADVEGSQVLSETLSQYSTTMVVERTAGVGVAQRLLRTLHTFYLEGRGSHETPEVPLLRSTDHEYIHYRKGAVVMYALKDYMGEARVNAALRNLVTRHDMRGPPYATTRDLHRELQAVTPDSLRPLLEDLFSTITLWDLQATAARAEPTGTGEYLVEVDIEAAKVRSDSIGNQTEVPMDDWVELGVFAPAGDDEVIGKPIYLRKHRIRSGRQTITVTVPALPARAGIDPFHKLIARRSEAFLNAKVPVVKIGGGSRSAAPDIP